MPFNLYKKSYKVNKFNFKEKEMPIDDGTGIMPGEACRACIHLVPENGIEPCPWGNSKYPNKFTMFLGDDFIIGNKCHKYTTYDDIGLEAYKKTNMIKQASKMTDGQLNVSLYRKIMALDDKERKKIFKYWDYLFPSDYAREMVDETNGTKAKNKKKKKEENEEKNKFEDGFKRKKGD